MTAYKFHCLMAKTIRWKEQFFSVESARNAAARELLRSGGDRGGEKRDKERQRERERERALSPADLIRNAAKFLREFWRGGQLAVPRG